MILHKVFWAFILLYTSSIFSQEQNEIERLHTLYIKNQNTDLYEANEYAQKSVLLSSRIKNDSLKLISYYYLAEVLYKKRKIEEAKEAITTVKNIAIKMNNPQYVCYANIYLGQIYRHLSNFEKSLEVLEEGLKLAKKHHFIDAEHKIKNGIAVLFTETKNAAKAKKILQEVLKNKQYTNPYTFAYTNNTLAQLYFVKDIDSSVYYYKKGIDLVENTNNDYLKTILFNGFGDLLIQKKDFKEALRYLELADKTATEISDYTGLFFINSSLGYYFHVQEKFDLAIEKYTKALEQYGEYADGNQLEHLYWLLSGTLYFNKQYKKAFEIQDDLLNLKDSLFGIEKNRTFERLQTEYEVAAKNDQIQFLEKEQRLEARQKKLIYSIGSLLFIGLIAAVFIYRYRIKSQKVVRKQEQLLYKQEKEQLKQSQKIKKIEGYIEGEEKEKNRIALELHDGIGGQLSGIKHYVSSLPETTQTKQLFRNVTSVSKEVRLLSHSLSSNYGIAQPLDALLTMLKDRYQNHFDIQIHLFPESEIKKIPEVTKLFLYRTIQEFINNTYKYAQATLVDVSITISDEIVLIVEDNGVGFSKEETPNGIGLHNIKERIQNINGEFVLDSALGNGTSVLIKIPNIDAAN